jgi:hypothetical protein
MNIRLLVIRMRTNRDSSIALVIDPRRDLGGPACRLPASFPYCRLLNGFLLFLCFLDCLVRLTPLKPSSVSFYSAPLVISRERGSD